MNIQAIEKVANKIQANLFKRSNSMSTGILKSHFKGSGLTFREHRVYDHGDDVRFIDWKLLAKTGTPYVKTFEEDRNVEIIVVIDNTSSMLMGHKDVSKKQMALEIACLLYLLAEKTKDKVQVILCDNEIIRLSPSSGKKGIVELITRLSKAGILDQSGKVVIGRQAEIKDKEAAFKSLLRQLKVHKEVVIISDFYDFLDLKHLEKLSVRDNLHCVQLKTPFDLQEKLPFSFMGRLFGKGGSRFQLSHSKLAGKKSENEKRTFRKLLGKKHLELHLDQPYLEEFIKKMI